VAVDRFSPAFRRPASARPRCFRAAVNAAGSATTSSTYTRYLNRIGRSVRAGPTPRLRRTLVLNADFAPFRAKERRLQIHEANLRYSSRDASGKFTGCVWSADAGIIPHMDAQQPRRNILAARIQVRLDRLGFTARAASIKAGLKPDAIRNIVRGKSQNPRGDTLRILARALECSVQYLVSGDDLTEDTPSDDYLPPNLPTLTM